MFEIGDWVKITPTPDLKWSRWYNNLDIYNEFLGKVGFVSEIIDDFDNAGNKLYAVTVDFHAGFMYSPPGEYYEYFKSDHLIYSSEYDAQLQRRTFDAGKELQEWENFKRKTTDDMLRYIFGKEEKKQEEIPAKNEEEKETKTEWDVKTDPGWNLYDD
jgi:hypothetical protein